MSRCTETNITKMASLKAKVVTWAFGDTIRAEAERIVKQAPAVVSRDPDEARWRRVTQSRRDLTPLDQDRMVEMANFLKERNLLGNRISQLRRDFVIGDGVRFEAEDKKVIQPLLDRFWNHPVNNLDEFQFQLVEYLGVNGELFLPVFVNEYDGSVQLGWLDPLEVDRVIADRHNRRVMREIVMKPGAGAGTAAYYDLTVKKVYSVVNVDLNPRSASVNHRVGDCLFFRINCAPDATRGRSDFEPLADLLDGWDQATFNDIERSQLVKNFIWDILFKGLTEEQIEARLEKMSEPAPGSLRGHNENVEWNAVSPDLKVTESRALTDGIRQDALGGAGLSDFFFGRTEGANRASSENIDVPILKGMTSRQRKVKAVFHETGDFVIDQAMLKQPVLRKQIKSGKISREFAVETPELSTRDLTRVGAVFSTTTSALDLAVERAWLRRETAAKVFAGLVMAQLGIEYDPVQEMKAAESEREDTIDYREGNVIERRFREAAAEIEREEAEAV